jgi:hypothetical protein
MLSRLFVRNGSGSLGGFGGRAPRVERNSFRSTLVTAGGRVGHTQWGPQPLLASLELGTQTGGFCRSRRHCTSEAEGVGSRFRPTINHMASRLPENDSRPLPVSNGNNIKPFDRCTGQCTALFTEGAEYTKWEGKMERQNPEHENQKSENRSLPNLSLTISAFVMQSTCQRFFR